VWYYPFIHLFIYPSIHGHFIQYLYIHEAKSLPRHSHSNQHRDYTRIYPLVTLCTVPSSPTCTLTLSGLKSIVLMPPACTTRCSLGRSFFAKVYTLHQHCRGHTGGERSPSYHLIMAVPQLLPHQLALPVVAAAAVRVLDSGDYEGHFEEMCLCEASFGDVGELRCGSFVLESWRNLWLWSE
jgi:hypothetical protein